MNDDGRAKANEQFLPIKEKTVDTRKMTGMNMDKMNCSNPDISPRKDYRVKLNTGPLL